MTDTPKESRQRLTLEGHVFPSDRFIPNDDPTDKEGSDIESNAENGMFSP
jgi:hypothetical protein